jgi:hypothetical protein
MNIRKVKTAIKVGTIIPCDDNLRKKIQIEWIGNAGVLKSDNGRVYLIVVNNKIFKIGGSQAKGGIKGTWQPYINSALGGSPSVRTYGIHILIREQFDMKKKVEIYMIEAPIVRVKVPGLFGKRTMHVAPFKEMESKCLNDFFNSEGRFPKWNFQESNEAWPIHLQEGCNKIKSNCIKKSKNK